MSTQVSMNFATAETLIQHAETNDDGTITVMLAERVGEKGQGFSITLREADADRLALLLRRETLELAKGRARAEMRDRAALAKKLPLVKMDGWPPYEAEQWLQEHGWYFVTTEPTSQTYREWHFDVIPGGTPHAISFDADKPGDASIGLAGSFAENRFKIANLIRIVTKRGLVKEPKPPPAG